jgi:large subunit ribosomal protein L25
MQQTNVEATRRDNRGKNHARRLRVAGQVPAILYGGKSGAEAISVNTKQVSTILRSQSGHNTIFTLKLAGGDQQAIVKEIQVDPVKGTLLHVDLLRIAMDVRMRVKVPVHTFGEAQGVKLQGGIFEMVTREVEIECLPTEIPEEFRVDITELMIGKQLRASEIPMDAEKMKLVTDPNRVIAHVVQLREEEEKPVEAVAADAAAPAEPEVIKKGKKETEEGEEGAEEPKAEAKPEKKEKK